MENTTGSGCDFYKVYIGDYCKNGLPNTWTMIGKFPETELKRNLKKLMKVVKRGMEIYVVTPKKEITAIFREDVAKNL